MLMRYDGTEFKHTEEYIKALEELLKAEIDMMQKAFPRDKSCWTWGICTVGDLCNSRYLQFEFGGEEDKPEGFPKDTNVWIKFVYEQTNISK